MLTGSAAHPRLAWALTEPVNITHRSTYHRPQPPRSRRVQAAPTPLIGKSPLTNWLGSSQERELPATSPRVPMPRLAIVTPGLGR